MIPRYSRPRMQAIWTAEHRFSLWREIEALATEALARQGLAPADLAERLRTETRIDPQRIDEIERETRHDVLAFLTAMNEQLGPDARALHRGMTSSDVLDTALSCQLVASCDLLLEGLDRLLSVLQARAGEHRHTPCIGRSHGIHAEPYSFGLKLAGHHAEFRRNRARLVQARGEVAVCAISGPVGTYAALGMEVEQHVARSLGLAIEPVSTQIIPRDRHAMLFAVLGVIASSAERLAVEIRHLQRTEVGEVEEFFHAGQKGSSAMPHKRNPVLSENVTGLARYVRAATLPMLENIALWHERDISHSSVERVLVPDALIALDFLLDRLGGLMENLVIHPERMAQNLDLLGGVIFSQPLMLALTDRGMSREDAYRQVQACAMEAQAGKGAFRQLVGQDAEISALLTPEQIEACFDPALQLRHVDAILARAFDGDPATDPLTPTG